MKIPFDNHLHTRASSCCRGDYSLTDVIEQAHRLGLRYTCVTDHIHSANDTAGIADHYHERAQWYSDHNSPEHPVYIGAEVSLVGNVANDFPHAFLSAECKPDFLIGGCHWLSNYPVSMGTVQQSTDYLCGCNDALLCDILSEVTAVQNNAIKRAEICVLTHPYDIFFRCGFFDRRMLDQFEETARLCRKYSVAVEINESSIRRCFNRSTEDFILENHYTVDPPEFFRTLISIACDADVVFSTGSDAHRLEDVGRLDGVCTLIKEFDIAPETLFALDEVPDKVVQPVD